MRIVFMGTPDFAVPCLEAIVNNGYDIAGVVTQPDKPVGRKQSQLKAPAVKEAAIRLGIKNILQPAKVKTPEFAEAVRQLEADLIVTAAYGRILTKAVLDLPKYGCINVHASLLPKYRGAAPIQWAIINGDAVTGITTMFMDEGMDTGDILLKREIEIGPDMNAAELFDKLKSLGAQTLLETLDAMKKGTLTRTPQDHSKAVYVPMMTKETGLIDWSKSAAEIHNLVRGTFPWPGAYTFYKGSRLKIWKTSVLDECPAGSPEQELLDTAKREKPGRILRISRQCLVAATGSGCVLISELQFENCRRMGVCECGHNMDEGEVLG
ncbi:MAG: methionyl-tRNA formyltransferase [Clostridiaceae bacterium]|nr:methionyl-tRNA formyltransferase [Clostridiaceae bacterium]